MQDGRRLLVEAETVWAAVLGFEAAPPMAEVKEQPVEEWRRPDSSSRTSRCTAAGPVKSELYVLLKVSLPPPPPALLPPRPQCYHLIIGNLPKSDSS